jgi:ketosteroid isomerase-like protein
MKAMSETSNFAQIIQQWLNYATQGDTKDLAALYTTDAVGVFPEGIFDGATNIINNLGGQFQNGWTIKTLTDKEDHQLGNNSAWSVGDWTGTFNGQAISGHWSVLWVQQSGAWKIQEQTVVQSLS